MTEFDDRQIYTEHDVDEFVYGQQVEYLLGFNLHASSNKVSWYEHGVGKLTYHSAVDYIYPYMTLTTPVSQLRFIGFRHGLFVASTDSSQVMSVLKIL